MPHVLSRPVRRLWITSLMAGTVGALAMMPFGLVFRLLEMRVGHYGPKFAALYMAAPGPWAMLAQHLVLGWLSAWPVCLLPLARWSASATWMVGGIYGLAYYLGINALALPLYFQDPLPWTLGAAVVAPSLVVHLVFGVAVATTARWLRQAPHAQGLLFEEI